MVIYRIEKCDNTPSARHECAHNILRQMLKDYTTHTYDELKIDENSKPYIDSVPFSVSHSDEVAVVAMCVADFCVAENDVLVSFDNCSNLGVDIESLSKDKEKCRKIATRKFFDSENAYLEEFVDDKEYVKNFAVLWTQKESYSKFTGRGLCDAMVFDTQKHGLKLTIKSDVITVGEQSYAITLCYDSL